MYFIDFSLPTLILNPSKCIFFQNSVKFLGHEVSEQGIHTDKDKIKAVQEWPVPRTVKQVRSFVGLEPTIKDLSFCLERSANRSINSAKRTGNFFGVSTVNMH